MATRTVIAGVALCLSANAASGEGNSPPRPLGSPANATDTCVRIHGRDGKVSGEAEVTVTVSAEGRVTGASSTAGTPEPLASAAQCVAAMMKFESALADGHPVAGKATVAIGFPTPPELRVDLNRAIQFCQPAIQPTVALHMAKTNAYEGTLDLLVKVGTDGKVVQTVLPEGVLPWMEDAARCLQDRLEFFPARLKLEPVESWTMVPVDFNLTRNEHEQVRLEAPTLRSGEEQILEAYRGCYPEGRKDQARINYRITVTDGGRVRKADVVATSGDTVLDQAGVCILRRLIFVPARRNGVNVEATVAWPILVRPPEG